MTLQEFFQDEKQSIQTFYREWLEKHKENPIGGAYPLDMSPGDWDEQFALFVEEKKKR